MMWEIPLWMVLALAGAVGQMLRACVGVKKAVERGEKIKAGRLISTILYAGFMGAVIGYFTEGIVKAISEKAKKEEE